MRRSLRGGILVAFACALVLAGFAFVPARADVESFTLFGSQTAGWGSTASSLSNPGPSIEVTQGDSVHLTLHSADGAGVSHNWFIDYNNNTGVDPGEVSSPDFTGSTVAFFNFTADRVGTFTYRCRFHPTTMTGVIVIQAPPTFELYGHMTRGWGEENITTAITTPGPTLTVNQSDNVILDLTSADGEVHSWFIDLNNDRLQQSTEPHSSDFTGSTRYTFQVTLAPGNYTYRCQYHPTVMFGTFTVRSSGGGGGTPLNTTLIIGGVVIVVVIVAAVGAMMMRRKKPRTPGPQP